MEVGKVILEGDPEYAQLYNLWVEQGKRGWIDGPGNMQIRALKDNETVKFVPAGGLRDFMNGNSAKGLTNGK